MKESLAEACPASRCARLVAQNQRQLVVAERELAHEIRVDKDGLSRKRHRAVAEVVDQDGLPGRRGKTRIDRGRCSANGGHHPVHARVQYRIPVQRYGP